MDPNWAAENLQVIRTLMERSAIYRRALAPMMLAAGGLGAVAAGIGCFWRDDHPLSFILYWMAVGVAAMTVALLLVRREALKVDESFWTPPARRVLQAILPPLLAGFLLTVGPMRYWRDNTLFATWLLPIWMLCYGCALHAAGFFMPRGMKLFGWVFIAAGAVMLGYLMIFRQELRVREAHAIMGASFGLLQLAYGVYLHFTEPQTDAP